MAEAAGVEPAKPLPEFMDHKSSGLADARRFRLWCPRPDPRSFSMAGIGPFRIFHSTRPAG